MIHILRAICILGMIAFFGASVLFFGLFVVATVSAAPITAMLSLVGCVVSLAGVSYLMENVS